MNSFEFVPNEILSLIFSYVPYQKRNWKSVLLTCKRFAVIGEKSFDPSLANNRAIRYAASEGHAGVRYDFVCA